jgi:hypothetical protein
MATKYGAYATNRDVSVPSVKNPGTDNSGKLAFFYDSYTFTADLAANDVINMFKIPAGARVVDMGIDSPDLDSASAGALTVGWAISADGLVAADDDGFLTTQDVHTAGKTGLMSAALVSANPGKLKSFASEVQVQVKISGETDATSGTIRLWALVAVA